MRPYADVNVPRMPVPFAMSARAIGFMAALTELADACDALTAAVEGHELAALVGATERAERGAAQVGRLGGELDDGDRLDLDAGRVRQLGDRLAGSARRNAFLIERAWALDAATMRLLIGLAGGGIPAVGGDGALPAGAAEYTRTPRPSAWLDRQA